MFLLLFLSVLMVTVDVGAGVNCSEEITFEFFEAKEHSYTTVSSNFSILVVNVSETLALGSTLYYITWKSRRISSYIDNDEDINTAWDYFGMYEEDDLLAARLDYTIENIVDYGKDTRVTDLDWFYYFKYISTDLVHVCKFQISHHIMDRNTQYPEFDQSSYSVELKENFTLNYPIEELQVKIRDLDATKTLLSLEMSVTGCPLGVNDSYESQNGSWILVPVFVKSPLDYEDTAPSHLYNCTLYLSDESFTSSTHIYISVAPVPEAPIFSSDFYTGTLMSVIAGSVVLVEPEINATDPDNSTNLFKPTIVYAITGTDKTGGRKYFEMDNSTGIVTVKREIGEDLLSLKEISFTITACDLDNMCALGFLLIKLPYINPSAINTVKFEKMIYSLEVEDPTREDELLQVHVQSTYQSQQNITYSFTGSSADQLYFSIDESSGIISLLSSNTPSDIYALTVMASNNIIDTTCEVNIKISTADSQMAFNEENVVSLNVSEVDSEGTVIYTVKSEDAETFCLLNVEPSHFENCLRVGRTTGNLRVRCELDIDGEYRDEGNIIHVRIGAYRDKNTDCTQVYNASVIYKNEVELEIEVIDNDDNDPYFLNQLQTKLTTTLVYYNPTVIQLQKILRKVATIKTADDDFVQQKTLRSDNINISTYYDMDTSTGAVLQISGSYVPYNIFFFISVNDYDSDYHYTTECFIYPIDIYYIFTLRLNNLNISLVEERLIDLSIELEIYIYLLYFNVIEKNSTNDFWTVDAHVYASDGYSIIHYSTILSNWVETDLSEPPREFADILEFDPEPLTIVTNDDPPGFETATIVMSTILGFLGCLVIGFAAFYVYARKFSGK